ncbi:hypothetical protein [Maribacter sp. HTCC2170]|uniref:hypothetical protein n=1 Tax=Maribacter sp. (strain HTCC2170 / KCCM 42371) TaxID=313603 RepID=UPI00006B47D8|nr:hypothetical protein [Maribacter sp. HTCC2170]EAR01654.1 hypothetical protein FB2170_14038 [Maribacter sp. HTCC2170]
MRNKVTLTVLIVLILIACRNSTEKPKNQIESSKSIELTFSSSNKELENAFYWAKDKALSFTHDNNDPVGAWYEAALPNREAFCMRDVSHQAIGAEILGLGKHNHNMFLKFAQNIDPEMDYCSYWEINRHNRPAPVDYESKTDFWYNLPANFDVLFNAFRLYEWTGNKEYLEHPDFQNFYDLSMNQYIDHWDLGADEVLARDRSMHIKKENSKPRFGNKRGIPTYNEGGRGETLLGIDMTASLIAAHESYAKILKISGDSLKSKLHEKKALEEREFMKRFWWDSKKQEYRSILYKGSSFDYFMVGEDQAFLHYLYYFDAIENQSKINGVIKNYRDNFDKLIVELKSYLPIMFYENGDTAMANKMIVDLCGPNNKRRDYPENSFTVIEHITRGLMGINGHAEMNTFSTISRLENDSVTAEMRGIPILSNKISVTHTGLNKSKVGNIKGEIIWWKAQIPGRHEFLYINGNKKKSKQEIKHGNEYSYLLVQLNPNDAAIVTSIPE